MSIQMPKRIFQLAAQSAEIDDVRYEASDLIGDCLSQHCPAVVGSLRDFVNFFGQLTIGITEESDETFDQSAEDLVSDLAERMVVDDLGTFSIYGFAGLELTV